MVERRLHSLVDFDPTFVHSLKRMTYDKLKIFSFTYRKEFKKAKKTKNYTDIKKFYFTTFESFANVCATLKRDPEFNGASLDDPGLKMELVHSLHDSLKELVSPFFTSFLMIIHW